MNSQNFGKIGRKMPVFWQKTVIFAEIQACRLEKKFRSKLNSGFMEMVQLAYKLV